MEERDSTEHENIFVLPEGVAGVDDMVAYAETVATSEHGEEERIRGENLESGAREGLLALKLTQFPFLEVGSRAIKIMRCDGRSAGDVDGYLVVPEGHRVKLGDVLPSGSRICQSSTLDLVGPCVVVFETKSSWKTTAVKWSVKTLCWTLWLEQKRFLTRVGNRVQPTRGRAVHFVLLFNGRDPLDPPTPNEYSPKTLIDVRIDRAGNTRDFVLTEEQEAFWRCPGVHYNAVWADYKRILVWAEDIANKQQADTSEQHIRELTEKFKRQRHETDLSLIEFKRQLNFARAREANALKKADCEERKRKEEERKRKEEECKRKEEECKRKEEERKRKQVEQELNEEKQKRKAMEEELLLLRNNRTTEQMAGTIEKKPAPIGSFTPHQIVAPQDPKDANSLLHESPVVSQPPDKSNAETNMFAVAQAFISGDITSTDVDGNTALHIAAQVPGGGALLPLINNALVKKYLGNSLARGSLAAIKSFWQAKNNKHKTAEQLANESQDGELNKLFRTALVDIQNSIETANMERLIAKKTVSASKPCTTCGKPAMMQCQRCKMAWYCSKECQKENWKAHKLSCNQTK